MDNDIRVMDKFLEDRDLDDMETFGYTTICVGDPPQNDVEEVQEVFERSPKKTASGIVFCGGGPECQKFLGTDNEEAEVMRFIKRRLGVNERLELIQSIAILEFQPQKDADLQPCRAHPVHSSDAISIFRPLNGAANWDNGFFAVYGSSHHQTPQEFLLGQGDIHRKVVEAHEVFAISGGSVVQPSPEGGLRMVWQGFSKRPMLEDMFAADAFEFMTGLGWGQANQDTIIEPK
ncbi:uncharacterized protein BJX67DRAFT_386618 [Aspergillus lucknowensis]|uniref:Class I glutamine amidotransferase-like protein n=1 Tax=Aspergillus lucknowensis TaxID=176173 RepID=A0ABR4L5Q1_9EURO